MSATTVPELTPGDATPLAEESAEPAESVTPGRELSRGSRSPLVVGLALALVGVAIFLGFQAVEFQSNRHRNDDRQDALLAAQRVAVAIATINPDSAKADINALAELGTDEFAKQLRTNLESQVEVIKTNQVSSTGEVRSAGVVSLKGDSAMVAVALASTVKNKATTTAEQRWYRMTVSLERQENGTWLVSELVFVQ